MRALFYLHVMFTISQNDKAIIETIVSRFGEGERVRALRKFLKSGVQPEHYIYLGEQIGIEKGRQLSSENDYSVFRLKTLSLLN